jgi:hypothetical protein
VVTIFNQGKKSLHLIKNLLELEFARTKESSKGSILRGNNIVSKLEGVYVRSIGTEYLKKVIKQLVDTVANCESFEIDPKYDL